MENSQYVLLMPGKRTGLYVLLGFMARQTRMVCNSLEGISLKKLSDSK